MSTRSIQRIVPGTACLEPFLALDILALPLRGEDEGAADAAVRWHTQPAEGFEDITYWFGGQRGGVDGTQAGEPAAGFRIRLRLPPQPVAEPSTRREIPAQAIRTAGLAGGGFIKMLAGAVPWGHCPLRGPGRGHFTTQAMVADVCVMVGHDLSLPVPATHSVTLHVFQGVLDAQQGRRLAAGCSVHFGGRGEVVNIAAAPNEADGVRVLLLAGRPVLSKPAAV